MTLTACFVLRAFSRGRLTLLDHSTICARDRTRPKLRKLALELRDAFFLRRNICRLLGELLWKETFTVSAIGQMKE